jgi:hypothetical protein
MMKALSIESEYVTLIIEGEKTNEYRSWITHHRGKILLHCKSIPGWSHGFIMGVAEIVDCKEIDQGYAFVLENPREVLPIKLRGMQKIFNVEIDESELVYTDEHWGDEEKKILIERMTEIQYGNKNVVKDLENLFEEQSKPKKQFNKNLVHG